MFTQKTLNGKKPWAAKSKTEKFVQEVSNRATTKLKKYNKKP